jgi:hypothetical protein
MNKVIKTDGLKNHGLLHSVFYITFWIIKIIKKLIMTKKKP